MKIIKNNSSFVMAGIILIICSIVLLLWFLLRGQITVNGRYPDDIATISMTCHTDNIGYPFFKDENVLESEIRINMTYNSDVLNKISLIYSGKYDAEILAAQAISRMTAAMNIDFAELGANAFNARYAVVDNNAQLTLSSSVNGLVNTKNRKYFLLDNTTSNELPAIKEQYELNGFVCDTINQ